MSKRVKHTKRVFAMLLAFIMCLSQAVTAAADEVSDNKTVPETVSEESAAAEPETGVAEETTSMPETVSDEEVPEEASEVVSEDAVSDDAEEPVGDTDPVSGNFRYRISGDEVMILGLSANSPTIHDPVIPEAIEGKPVTVINDNAFDECKKLTGNLTIPNSVTTIGVKAFCKCTGFTGNLTIGNRVETIKEYAFYECTGFTGNLTIGNSVKTISNNAFDQCNKLSGNLIIPNSVETIGESAFTECTGFTGNLTIGNRVETIKKYAFYGCTGFTGKLTIGNNVKTIEEFAFRGCTGFTGSFTIPDSVETIGQSAFSGCTGFTGSLTIPNSVETIGGSAFRGCTGFDGKLTIPNSVETIGGFTFYECSGFTGSLTIPDSVETIANYAFEGCYGFDGDLTIPDSVETIDERAFRNCYGFKGKLTIPDSVETIGYQAFDKCYKISSITNKSSKEVNLSFFWADGDTKTVCFVSDNGTEIHNNGASIKTGEYVRKINTPPTGVSLNKTSLEVNVGTPETLKATVSPTNSYWDKVSWNSSVPGVATVSNGVVTGIKPGNTVITATTVSGGFSASCNVTVKRIPATGVTLNKSAISMYPNETETLIATVQPADASTAVRWFSSNEKVATVNNGVVTSVSPGSAVITVSTNDGGFTAKCTVTVYTKETAHKVTFKKDDGTVFATQTVANGKQAADPGAPAKAGYIFIGWSDGASIWNFTTPVNKDLVLTAKYKAEQVKVSENSGSGMDPTPVTDAPEKKGDKTAYKLYLVKDQTFTAGGKGWTTTDKGTAAVAANTGKITGKKTGTATVENDTTVYTVYVAEPSVSKNSKNVTVLVGQSAEVGIDLQAVTGTENKYPITWYSANPKVAVVNGGMVTGVAKGSTKVKAYVGGKTYDATVKVTDTYKAPARYTDNRAEFAMNPLQSFSVKFDSNVFIIKNAVWSGDGMTEVKNSKGNVTGYKNGVISIATSGKFTAIGPGTTTVTGKDSKSNTVTVTVTVVPVATREAVYITKGKTDTIKFPKVTNSKADRWTSSNENAAKFATTKKDGKVKGINYGRSDISCLYKGFTFNTTAYIEDPEMIFAGKTINSKDKVEMKVGEMKQFKVNKVYQTLNYKSSKQATVFVDESGFVYARKPGKATISTKINGATYKFTVEVKE